MLSCHRLRDCPGGSRVEGNPPISRDRGSRCGPGPHRCRNRLGRRRQDAPDGTSRPGAIPPKGDPLERPCFRISAGTRSVAAVARIELCGMGARPSGRERRDRPVASGRKRRSCRLLGTRAGHGYAPAQCVARVRDIFRQPRAPLAHRCPFLGNRSPLRRPGRLAEAVGRTSDLADGTTCGIVRLDTLCRRSGDLRRTVDLIGAGLSSYVPRVA